MKNLKLILVVGARPNFMKIAPLILAIRNQKNILNNGSVRIGYRRCTPASTMI